MLNASGIFFIASGLVVAASRLAVDLFREEKSRKTSGTRVLRPKRFK